MQPVHCVSHGGIDARNVASPSLPANELVAMKSFNRRNFRLEEPR
jgi:hypothetical protein